MHSTSPSCLFLAPCTSGHSRPLLFCATASERTLYSSFCSRMSSVSLCGLLGRSLLQAVVTSGHCSVSEKELTGLICFSCFTGKLLFRVFPGSKAIPCVPCPRPTLSFPFLHFLRSTYRVRRLGACEVPLQPFLGKFCFNSCFGCLCRALGASLAVASLAVDLICTGMLRHICVPASVEPRSLDGQSGS